MTPIPVTTFVDRAGWPSGPWDAEPDKVTWVDKATGLDCMIRRGGGGAWCGYVGVPPWHPWHGVDYDDCTVRPRTGLRGALDALLGRVRVCRGDWHYDCSPGRLVEVHGGLTFADACDDGDEGTGICHVPEPGRPDDVWWFGFDCSHLNDLRPGSLALDRELGLRGSDPGDVYRDQAYVTGEVESLARQLAAQAAA